MIAQYLSRLLFSFDYEKRLRQFGAIWGGLGITAITYFMLIKGAKGASFMSADLVQSIQDNTMSILLWSFVGWVVILFLMNQLFKINILKVLVLVGTFALAMAFAGNDLVNFIGVPLAGYNSYQLYVESNAGGADQFLMDGLAGKVPTPTLLLIIAGLIMVATLYLSKKAKSVIKTSLDLGRQEEGTERFSSFMISRSIVRNFATMATFVNDKMPDSIQRSINNQFDQTAFTRRQVHLGKEAPAFDMVRAAVTLVVASILIAIGTSLKLPLSTTYVTFMVFMGTSLADGAWGRESAVYRVSGVISVIGGWFFTALSAFVVAFVLAGIFHYGGIIAIIVILCFAAVILFRSHRYHSKKVEEQLELEKTIDEGSLTKARVISLCAIQLKTFLKQYGTLTDKSLTALNVEDLNSLNQSYQAFKPILKKIKSLKVNSSNALERVPDHELEAGHLYILVVDYLNEMAKEVMDVIKSNLDYIDNNHKPLLPEQIEEMEELHALLKERYLLTIDIFKNLDSEVTRTVLDQLPVFVQKTREIRKNQIKRIKKNEVGTRNTVLYLSHLSAMRNLALFCNRIVKVFDELILNPIEETDFTPSTMKKELKQMKKEAKSIASTDPEDLPARGGSAIGQDSSGSSDDQGSRSDAEVTDASVEPESEPILTKESRDTDASSETSDDSAAPESDAAKPVSDGDRDTSDKSKNGPDSSSDDSSSDDGKGKNTDKSDGS
ncbi:MAG: phosphate permease [Bacteroidetes bacterium]|nr:MAG: phosphate permease [Bacteroidota bacterium]